MSFANGQSCRKGLENQAGGDVIGLDMYLTRKSYLSRDYVQNEQGEWHWRNKDSVKVEGVGLLKGVNGVKEICEEAAYWRKANQIHAWFVNNVQDGEDECRPHEVGMEQLKELVDTCKKVLANPELAPELLPSQSGFFFGGTDYDEYYFSDLKNTVEQLEPLIEFDEKNQQEGVLVYYEYQSSW